MDRKGKRILLHDESLWRIVTTLTSALAHNSSLITLLGVSSDFHYNRYFVLSICKSAWTDMSQNGVLCLYYISVISFNQVMGKKQEWYCLSFERLGKITQYFNEDLYLVCVGCKYLLVITMRKWNFWWRPEVNQNTYSIYVILSLKVWVIHFCTFKICIKSTLVLQISYRWGGEKANHCSPYTHRANNWTHNCVTYDIIRYGGDAGVWKEILPMYNIFELRKLLYIHVLFKYCHAL